VALIAGWQKRAFANNDTSTGQSPNDASLGANGGVLAAISGRRTVLALGTGVGACACASTGRSGADA